MNPLKTLSFTACALVATTQVGSASISAGFSIYKEYRQDSTRVPVFQYGTAIFTLFDGNFLYTANCIHNNQGTIFGVDTANGANCSIGANGVELDTFATSPPLIPAAPVVPPAVPPAPVDARYLEILSIEPAVSVEPGRNDLVRLYSIPANSRFPTTLPTVVGRPSSLFFNLQTPTVKEYRFSGYASGREYFSRKQMEQEIVQGTYTVSYPTLKAPTRPQYVPFNVISMVEGYIGGNTPGGFKFIDAGPLSSQGFYQYDPRVVNTFRWTGLSPAVVRGTDQLYISFKRLAGTTADSVVSTTVFPPAGGAILLDNPYISEYVLPPGFFANNDRIVAEVEIRRTAGVNGGEVSRRIFQLPVSFVNTFVTSMALAFPTGNAALVDKNADPDGDGISNWVEWLSGTDPAVANPPKTLTPIGFVPPSPDRSGESTEGYWQMAFDRQEPYLLGAKPPVVESSTDLKTWTVIDTSGATGWKIVDEGGPQIFVRNSSASLSDKRYFRLRYNADL